MKIYRPINLIFILLALSPFSSFAKAIDFVGRASDLELFLAKTEGWPKSDLKKKEIHLQEKPKSLALAVSSDSECGTRTCTTYLFESLGKDRYRLVGRIDGIMNLLPEADHEHFRIKAKSALGGAANESSSVIYQYDGKQYEPTADVKSGL